MKKIFFHFIDRDFVSHASHMTSSEYAKVLDNVVIACVDLAVTNKGRLLLGKRSRPPLPDWCIIGGRMMPGESFQETGCRNLERELGLNVQPDRLEDLAVVSTAWSKRAQQPQENGSHTVISVFNVEVSDQEAAHLRPNDEYTELKWVPLAEAEGNSYHGYVKEVTRLLRVGK